MKALVVLVGLTIVALAVSLYFRLGASKPVVINEAEYGPFKTISKRHVGAYYKIVPVIEEVETWAKKNGEPCQLSFGEFLDDPNKVVEDRQQSNGGCVVEKTWTSGLPEGFTFKENPRRLFVIAEFDGAPSIGPLKVYPRAKEFIEEHHYQNDGPVIEMYEILPEQKVKTHYYFPVKRAL